MFVPEHVFWELSKLVSDIYIYLDPEQGGLEIGFAILKPRELLTTRTTFPLAVPSLMQLRPAR